MSNYTNSPLVGYTRLVNKHSGQRTHCIDRITPHCVVGQVTAARLGDIFSGTRDVSSNYGIALDGTVGLYVEEKNRSWCSSSNANDQRAITIECASDPKPPYAFKPVVYETLIKLCIDICKRNGKKKLLWFGDKPKSLNYSPKSDEMVLTVHRWFANKSCPGDWLYARMGDLAQKVTSALSASSGEPVNTPTASVRVKTYSLKTDKNKKLSAHFVVEEFASRDGADEVKIDTKLVDYLEKIRTHFNKPTTINSGYRTPEHNAKVGGVKDSYHVKGMAADICVQGAKSKDVALYAESLKIGGIGWYEKQNFVHIDTRSGSVRWKDDGNNVVKTFSTVTPAQSPSTKCPYTEPKTDIQFGSNGNGVKWVQWYLNKAGEKLSVDGEFGALTKAAVLRFQKKQKLAVDGVVGAKTRATLKKAVK